MDQRIDIIWGDAIESMSKLPDGSVNLIIADPPYNLNKDYGNNQDKLQFDDYLNFTRQWLTQAKRILTSDGTIRNARPIDDFSAVVSYAEVKAKGYSLSAGQYFDIKIDYVDITEDEFNAQMKADMDELESMFSESHRLEDEIRSQLKSLRFGE